MYTLTEDGARILAEMVDSGAAFTVPPDFVSQYDPSRLAAIQDMARRSTDIKLGDDNG